MLAIASHQATPPPAIVQLPFMNQELDSSEPVGYLSRRSGG
jgi:hypothetical protein